MGSVGRVIAGVRGAWPRGEKAWHPGVPGDNMVCSRAGAGLARLGGHRWEKEGGVNGAGRGRAVGEDRAGTAGWEV